MSMQTENMSETRTAVSPTFAFYMKEGRRLADTHRFIPAGRESVKQCEIQVREIGGGRASPQESVGQTAQFGGLPIENLAKVLEALDALHELALESGEEILQEECIIRWLREIVRVHVGGNEGRQEVENALEALTSPNSEANSSSSGPAKLYEEGDNPYMDQWLSDVFVEELAAKINNQDFVGGADDVPAISISAACPYCSKPVGDVTDQHVLKCSFAHEEQERLFWTLMARS